MSKISKLKTNEGKKHLEAKQKLFNLLLNNDVTIVDQFGKIANTWSHEFMAMESYSFAQMEYSMCPYHYGGSCTWCYENEMTELAKELKLDSYECIDYMFEMQFDKNAFNEICIKDKPYNMAFTSHPCSICKFKDRLDCILIFDIGLAREGCYSVAIEVVDTSHIKENKLEFCQKNEIVLLEIEVDDILNYTVTSENLKCIRYWWRTIDGKII